MVFFLLSNFGVWLVNNLYDTVNLSLIETYIIAIPFMEIYLSTIIFSIVIEYLISLKKVKLYLSRIY